MYDFASRNCVFDKDFLSLGKNKTLQKEVKQSEAPEQNFCFVCNQTNL